ncbi:MAG: AI-2E family transporter [Granulosicoccaceae bacterium]
MLDLIHNWYQRHFSDPQAVILALFLVIASALILLLGNILAPLLIAAICAYLLEGVVRHMDRLGTPRGLSASLVLAVFLLLILALLFVVAPLLFQQVTQLFLELPRMIGRGQQELLRLPEVYPTLNLTKEQINDIVKPLTGEVVALGQAVLSFSVANVLNVFAFAIYFILVPMMVFFALKDKNMIIGWVTNFMPTRSALSKRVWAEVDLKVASYVRGKFIEIVIVWVVTYLVFALMGLNYSLLLSFLVGISVIVPFVGAFAVTLPVAVIAYFQWGLSADFYWLLFSYVIIQVLDGNVLVPILFSGVVSLHPLAIIVAVLFFGGLWGVWGVFFAIPLATFVHALLKAWPSSPSYEPG